MRAPAGLRLDYLSAAEYRTAQWPDVLGIATFSGPPDSGAAVRAGEIPVAEISLPLLLGTTDVCEVWRSELPVESGRRNRVSFRRTETLLFGSIALAESEISAAGGTTPGHS